MADSHLNLLLRLVKTKEDVSPLRREGLEYSQIAKLLAHAIDTGLVSEREDEYILTPAGYEFVQRTSAKRRPKESWIRPEVESRIKKLGVNKPYLPGPDSSYFEPQ